jgi:hypothetical protein
VKKDHTQKEKEVATKEKKRKGRNQPLNFKSRDLCI